MRSPRDLVTSLFFGALSLAIVLGGVSLSLAESNSDTFQSPPTPAGTLTASPTTLILEAPSPTSPAVPAATETPSPTLVPPTNCPPPSGWVAITLQTGETLAAIAAEHNTTVDQLVRYNCLPAASAPPGAVLYVPNVPTHTPAPCRSPAGWITYIVRPGDTLYRIAVSYGVTLDELRRANCRGTSYLLHVGERLYVPNVPTQAPSITQTLTGTVTATNPEPAPTDTLEPSATLEPSDTSASPTETETATDAGTP